MAVEETLADRLYRAVMETVTNHLYLLSGVTLSV
jgi:hypothetical protein